MAGHLAWQWAGHGQQWPAMAGHGWSCPDNGQSMVSQGPSAQAHGNVWHCVPVFGPESCTLHQAAIPAPGPKPKIQNQSFQNKIPKLRNCESKGIQNTTPKPETLSHRFQTDAILTPCRFIFQCTNLLKPDLHILAQASQIALLTRRFKIASKSAQGGFKVRVNR